MAYDNSVPFSFTKNGIFYFERRVPRDLLHHYDTPKITYSLRTRSTSVASSRARRAADQLDEYWYHLRVQNADLPGKHRIRIASGINLSPKHPLPSEAVKLSEAVGVYLRLKGQGRTDSFHRAAERSCGYVIDACGDKDLAAYTKADANTFRDALLERNMAGSSITRIFGTVRAVINFTTSEMGLSMANPFTGVYYDRSIGVEGRQPLSVEDIKIVQSECIKINDEMRWLVALVSDTGLRLAEAAGLHIDDLKLDAPIPHVEIREHPWRRLKTIGSNRSVPLVGASLWAATRVVSENQCGLFAFPRYNVGKQTNANSASAALNKWMKQYVTGNCTMHSFRHSLRDRLRAVECPSDIVDQIGGWQTEGAGQSYGQGYPLLVLHKWLQTIDTFG